MISPRMPFHVKAYHCIHPKPDVPTTFLPLSFQHFILMLSFHFLHSLKEANKVNAQKH